MANSTGDMEYQTRSDSSGPHRGLNFTKTLGEAYQLWREDRNIYKISYSLPGPQSEDIESDFSEIHYRWVVYSWQELQDPEHRKAREIIAIKYNNTWELHDMWGLYWINYSMQAVVDATWCPWLPKKPKEHIRYSDVLRNDEFAAMARTESHIAVHNRRYGIPNVFI